MTDVTQGDVREALEEGHRDIIDIIDYAVERDEMLPDEYVGVVARLIGQIEGEDDVEYEVQI